MREVTPTRSTAIELADERKLMRQGYEFLDEKRMLLATEMLRQLKLYQQRSDDLIAATKRAAQTLSPRRSSGTVSISSNSIPAPSRRSCPASSERCFLVWPCCRRASRRSRKRPATAGNRSLAGG